MIEYVFRPTRMRKGKRVQSRLYSGAYSLGRGEKSRRVGLHTPDKRIAEKRLRDIIVKAQMEKEGMVLPKELREAAHAPLSQLVGEYQSDLLARTSGRNAFESVARIKAAIEATGWRFLVDVTPSSWVAYRATLKQAAKTRRDYQTSMMAFLNWLVRLDRLPRNPLEKVDRISIKGKQVRPVRAFTDDEIHRLLSVCGPRRFAYLFLLYTGLRKGSAKKLVVSDLHLDGPHPYVLVRASTMKGGAKLALPLKPELVDEIRRVLPADALPDRPVFYRSFPRKETLSKDLARAGIVTPDGQGRVVHFHAFRKTFQTLGVRSGVNQRSAQALLAHSDPSLTANVYTDVAALELHDEVAKLPWFGSPAVAKSHVVNDAQNTVQTVEKRGLREVLADLINIAQDVVSSHDGDVEKWWRCRDLNPGLLGLCAPRLPLCAGVYLAGVTRPTALRRKHVPG
jgi:integrase